ncbi:hypothetical protein Aduo_013644 [Ancylostoma duodenale]
MMFLVLFSVVALVAAFPGQGSRNTGRHPLMAQKGTDPEMGPLIGGKRPGGSRGQNGGFQKGQRPSNGGGAQFGNQQNGRQGPRNGGYQQGEDGPANGGFGRNQGFIQSPFGGQGQQNDQRPPRRSQ